MRIAADRSKDPVLDTIFKENRDPHREAAVALFKKDDISSVERNRAKTFNFAVLYGASAGKISEEFEVSRGEAKKLISNYFETFSKLEEFQLKTLEDALKTGYIVVDSLGKKSFVPIEKLHNLQKLITLDPEYKSEYKKLLGEIQRACCNYPIQSQAALIAKYAGILMFQHQKKHLFRLCLLEHDCWIVECASTDASEVRDIVEDCMVKAAKKYCSIHIPADAAIHCKWEK